MNDLQKLLFPRANVRGETVSIASELEHALEHQALPLAVRRLAGEAAAAALLAAAALRFDGALQLQIDGDGPVRLLVVEVKPASRFRIMAQLRSSAREIDDNATLRELVNAGGRGRCALILDMRGRTREQAPYQGIVPLEAETLSAALEEYFRRSEQIETVIRVAADGLSAGGVMLQKLPETGGKLPEDYDPEGWSRLKMFADTVKSRELLTLEPAEVNRRLFWEESPLVTGEEKPAFVCSCSEERFREILRSVGREEAESMLKDEGKITLTCRFCGRSMTFDRLDVEALFAGADGKAEA